MSSLKTEKLVITFLSIILTIDIALLLSFWIESVVRTNTHFSQTFSWLLATDEVLQGQYLGWLPYHLFVALTFTIKEVVSYKSPVCGTKEHNSAHCCGGVSSKCRHAMVGICIGLSTGFTLLTIPGFILIYVFPTTTMSTPHAVWAAVTFVSLFLLHFFLMVKRYMLCTYKKNKLGWYTLLTLDTMFVIAIFVLLILFVILDTGQLEFAIVTCVMVAYVFQLAEFYLQSDCIETHKISTAPTTHITFNLKRYLYPAIGSEKNKLLSYEESQSE
jgi:hypothetical protein